MRNKKRPVRPVIEEKLERFGQKLEKTGRRTEDAFGKLEKRIEDAAKSAEDSLERFGTNLQGTFERLDKRFEETEKKLEYALETDGLKKYFQARGARRDAKNAAIRAVDGVDLGVTLGETLAIVGESGCGKSTIARVMIGLLPPTAGHVRLFGTDLTNSDKEAKKEMRRRTGIVFQDPYGSLDPRMTVADIVCEPLRAHKLCENRTGRHLAALEMLEACGLNADNMFQFPHQFSGGERQRICIARALVAGPDIVVCDEAVSALDVSIQAQIINLLCDLREARGLTYIFISHDLDVVRFIADRVAVMYLGKVVELAPKEALFNRPCHPYTADLLESAPVFGRRAGGAAGAAKDSAAFEPAGPPECGCRYFPRCRVAMRECAETEPRLRAAADGHFVACHRI